MSSTDNVAPGYTGSGAYILLPNPHLDIPELLDLEPAPHHRDMVRVVIDGKWAMDLSLFWFGPFLERVDA